MGKPTCLPFSEHLRYRNEIIVPVVRPFIQRRNRKLFQQDKAGPHTTVNTQLVLQADNVQSLDWASHSTALSPNNFERALHEEWVAVLVETLNQLISSMRRRCGTLIDRDDYHTRY